MENFGLSSPCAYLQSLSVRMCVFLGSFHHLKGEKGKIKDPRTHWEDMLNIKNYELLLTQSLPKLIQYIIFINRPFFPNRKDTTKVLLTTLISFTAVRRKSKYTPVQMAVWLS